MVKIHVLTQKELIDPRKLENCVAVIFDVLLATTTITTLLQHKAKNIIPALNVEEALMISQELSENSYILSGEKEGFKVDSFLFPCPIRLIEEEIVDKSIILATTNGTVALKQALPASSIYASCFLNNASMAKHLFENHREQTILLICAGNHGRLSLEDFLGTGHLIKEFFQCAGLMGNIQLSDSAMAAFHLYNGLEDEQTQNILYSSQTGRLLSSFNNRAAIDHALQRNKYEIIPILRKGKNPYIENLQIVEKTPVN